MTQRGTIFAKPGSVMEGELLKFELAVEHRFGYNVIRPVREHLEEPNNWRHITTLLESKVGVNDPLLVQWKQIYGAFQRTAAGQVRNHQKAEERAAERARKKAETEND